MAQLFRVLIVLADDPGSVDSTCMVTQPPNSSCTFLTSECTCIPRCIHIHEHFRINIIIKDNGHKVFFGTLVFDTDLENLVL